MALFHRNTWPHPMTKESSMVLVGTGRAKSIVRRKVVSKNDDVIVQSSQDVATLVAQLMSATTVLHVSQADIDYKECGTLG